MFRSTDALEVLRFKTRYLWQGNYRVTIHTLTLRKQQYGAGLMEASQQLWRWSKTQELIQSSLVVFQWLPWQVGFCTTASILKDTWHYQQKTKQVTTTAWIIGKIEVVWSWMFINWIFLTHWKPEEQDLDAEPWCGRWQCPLSALNAPNKSVGNCRYSICTTFLSRWEPQFKRSIKVENPKDVHSLLSPFIGSCIMRWMIFGENVLVEREITLNKSLKIIRYFIRHFIQEVVWYVSILKVLEASFPIIYYCISIYKLHKLVNYDCI